MPNYVAVVLEATGDHDALVSMLERIKNDEKGIGSIDFEKIIPIPEHIFRGNIGAKERKKYGNNNWYDWCINNWGTKWNAMQTGSFRLGLNDVLVMFETAWDYPDKVIAELAKQYKELVFNVKWSDENIGYNVGRQRYESGKEVLIYEPESGSKEAKDMSNRIWGGYENDRHTSI